MYRVAVSDLEDGLKVARTVYYADGRVIIRAGTELKDRYIERLREMGVPAVYVSDERSRGIQVREVTTEGSRLKAMKVLKKTAELVRLGRRIEVDQINQAVSSLAYEVKANSKTLVHLTDTWVMEEYIYGHHLNVCIYALVLGSQLGYNFLRMVDLGVGALLHDIGLLKLHPRDLVNTERVRDEVFEAMRQHSVTGFNLLRETPGINLLSAHVAYQHHENYDGTGYPRSLKGEEIHNFARIVAIADAYDLLTGNRPRRRPCPPAEAAEILVDCKETILDPALVDAFVRNIAVYPIGSMVVLSSGETGVVIENNYNYPTRPIVKIVDTKNLWIINELGTINLVQHPNIKIIDEKKGKSIYNPFYFYDISLGSVDNEQ